MRYMLVDYSRHVAKAMAAAGFVLVSLPAGRSMCEAVFRASNDVFGLRPRLTSSQFMSKGFVEHKLIFATQLAGKCLEFHTAECRRQALAAMKVAPRLAARRPLVPVAPPPVPTCGKGTTVVRTAGRSTRASSAAKPTARTTSLRPDHTFLGQTPRTARDWFSDATSLGRGAWASHSNRRWPPVVRVAKPPNAQRSSRSGTGAGAGTGVGVGASAGLRATVRRGTGASGRTWSSGFGLGVARVERAGI